MRTSSVIRVNNLDLEIIKILQENCRISIKVIAKKLGIPKSTVYYRIKRLEEEGIIKGYHAKVDFAKLGQDYLTITFIRAKYGPGYHEKIGQKLSKIPGVFCVFFLFGENDFIILTRSSNREDYLRKLEEIMNMPEIERTNTQIIAKVIKENLNFI
ncbi:Lrp/AsnC family transcriptional regulator [Candidatus Bathyarchaeota archaeon]|nr:MAG: Lrp/AsnC family transcriptional regulator [Candidatus Bathyarchaeota archaeon]